MRVLVTGANGFIGSNLVRLLLSKGEEVRAFIKPQTQEETLAGLEVERCYGDIRDAEALSRAIQGCHEVYHLAAYSRLWAPDHDPFVSINAEGTRNLLRAAASANVRRVVHTSTCDILGIRQRRHGKEGTEEDVPLRPSQLAGPYGLSKWMAELLALSYAAKGLECVIVNPTIPIGRYDTLPTEPGRLIADFVNGRLSAFINRRMNFVDVKGCALGHYLAMKKGRSGERYILGGANMDLAEFFARLERITGIPAPKMRVPYFAGYGAAFLMGLWSNLSGREPRASLEGVRLVRHSFAFDSQKAQRELGYQCKDITDALREAVDWHRERRVA